MRHRKSHCLQVRSDPFPRASHYGYPCPRDVGQSLDGSRFGTGSVQEWSCLSGIPARCVHPMHGGDGRARSKFRGRVNGASSKTIAVVVAMASTLVAVLLMQNWSAPELALLYRLPKLYEYNNMQYRRSLSTMLGPTTLSGHQIFPAMPFAIKSAQCTIGLWLNETLETGSFIDELFGVLECLGMQRRHGCPDTGA